MNEPLQNQRRRPAENGIKRVEVCVRQSDADLIRRVARALAAADAKADRLRSAIEKSVPKKSTLTFKEWLATPSSSDEA